MPSATHVIGRQVLELRLGSDRDAYRLQQRLAELFETAVVPGIEALLDRLVPADRVLRLDRLELDLGSLPPETLAETFPRRACEALERALTPYLRDLQGDLGEGFEAGLREDLRPPSADTAAPPEPLHLRPSERILALWHHVLVHGALPWWAERASAVTLEGDLLAALAAPRQLPAETRELLREQPHALRRLALQGSSALRARVLELAAPALAALALPLLDALALRPDGGLPLPDAVLRTLWEALLHETLHSPATPAETSLERALRDACGPPAAAPLRDALSRLLERPALGAERQPLSAVAAATRERLVDILDRVLGETDLSGPQGSAPAADGGAGAAIPTGAEEPFATVPRTEARESTPVHATNANAATEGDKRVRRTAARDLLSGDRSDTAAAQTSPSSLDGHAANRWAAPADTDEAPFATSVGTGPIAPTAGHAVTDADAQVPDGDRSRVGREFPPGAAPRSTLRPAAPPGRNADIPPRSRKPTSRREREAIYVDDAGLVLLHPFLATHFEKLGLQREGQFLGETARERAIYQLHFLATGHEDAPETLVVLPKLLCGLLPEQPIVPAAPPDALARTEADKLLAAVVRHWGALKNTSPDGLREAFLRREGRLEPKDGDWRLRVETRSWDLLLGRLPWPLSVVRLPWMSGLLFIEWG